MADLLIFLLSNFKSLKNVSLLHDIYIICSNFLIKSIDSGDSPDLGGQLI